MGTPGRTVIGIEGPSEFRFLCASGFLFNLFIVNIIFAKSIFAPASALEIFLSGSSE
jgi:hypothetical protein